MDAAVTLALVKQEDIVGDVCFSCLSQNRVLSPLNDHVDLFLYLLGEQGCSLELQQVLLCWECMAVLNRISRFQWQVQYAHIVQQNMLSQAQIISPKPLSNLGIFRIDNIDSIIVIETELQYEISNIEKLTDKDTTKIIKNEENTIDKKDFVLQQIEDETDFDANYDELPLETPEIKIKQEFKTKTSKINKKKSKGKSKKKYKNKVKRTVNPDVDLNNISTCFTSMLTESDMDIVNNRKMGKYKEHTCLECNKVFKSLVLLRSHKTFCHILEEKSPGPFICLECSFLCADKSALRAHWDEHKLAAKCKLCGELVVWKTNMNTHAKMHKYLWTCKLCTHVKAVFRSSKEFGWHYRAIHRRAICDYCGSKHKSKKALQHHISLRHLPPYCTTCDKEFKDAHSLRRHTHYTHPALLDKAVDPDLTYCVECDRQFASEFKYKLHLKTAVVHNPAAACSRKARVPCPDCGKVFTRKSYMNNHRRQVHTRETKHYCQPCDKYLVSAWSMKKHIEGVHQKIRQPKNKICDLCGRAFQTNAVLIKHIRTHTGERPYKCAHCPAAFTQSSALNSHTRTQHKLL